MANVFAPINRKQFWWRVAAWVLLQVSAIVVVAFVPLPDTVVRGVSIGITAWLAIVVAARLADAGYRAWIGPVVVIGLCAVLPIFGVLLAIFLFGVEPADVIAAAPLAVIVAMLVLLAFIVWAGTRPSVARPENWTDQFADEPDDHQRVRRVEPRF